MTRLNESEIKELIIHYVGNKSKDESLQLSTTCVVLDDLVTNLLTKYFLSPFIFNESYSFTHDLGLNYNGVYSELKRFFNKELSFYDFSRMMAMHLYESSVHPNIKAGEFYIVYFDNCIIDNKTVEGVGFFKSENRETYLKIYTSGDSFDVQPESGISIKGLDKGCIVLNINHENGFVSYVVDKTNKSSEAKYWTNDFLGLKRNNDSFVQTQNAVAMCKSFISQMPDDVAKSDKAAMMNRVIEGMKSENVVLENLAAHAFGQDVAASCFKAFKEDYEATHDVRFDESFQSKPEAIKRRATGSMTTIKLDKNFDVNIHGGEQFIERGYDDEKGMRYYKLYFNEEK